MISATEQLNCIITSSFLEKEDWPVGEKPFNTLTGLNDER